MFKWHPDALPAKAYVRSKWVDAILNHPCYDMPELDLLSVFTFLSRAVFISAWHRRVDCWPMTVISGFSPAEHCCH